MEEEHIRHNDATEQAIIANVERYGCHIALLDPDNYLPGFAYSIGLFKTYRHPEIICFGMKRDVMGWCINHARDRIRDGEILTTGRLYSGFLEGYDVAFLLVDKAYYQDYLGYAGWFNDNAFDFPALQLVWPDKQHRFPWDDAFNPDWKFKQPLLDRNTDFKFYEERNLGVFTTKQAFNRSPILFVYHNDDGDWQFHTSADPDPGDAVLVCLEDITKLDPTINELFHLQPGWHAWRETAMDKWEYAADPLENT